MILAEFFFALAISLFITTVFTVLSRRVRPWRYRVVFFLLIFLAAWAGGIWITPVGPVLLGVYWVSFFVVGLVFALVMEALTTLPSRRGNLSAQDEAKEEKALEMTFSAFLWLLFLGLIAIVVLGYLFRR